jgi:hypothetical protein
MPLLFPKNFSRIILHRKIKNIMYSICKKQKSQVSNCFYASKEKYVGQIFKKKHAANIHG